MVKHIVSWFHEWIAKTLTNMSQCLCYRQISPGPGVSQYLSFWIPMPISMSSLCNWRIFFVHIAQKWPPTANSSALQIYNNVMQHNYTEDFLLMQHRCNGKHKATSNVNTRKLCHNGSKLLVKTFAFTWAMSGVFIQPAV